MFSVPHLRVKSPVLIHTPSTQYSYGAGPGMTLDAESDALILQSDMTDQIFVLLPSPGKTPRVNGINDLEAFNGRLYIGYGDIDNNFGPVDIVSYDLRTGALRREMLNIPEEEVGGWWIAADGRMYVAGLDAKENWTFGNFYMNDGFGWQKRRTIHWGAHVYQIIDFKGRLYAAYVTGGTIPVNYPFVLVSDNFGATWLREKLADDAVYDAFVTRIVSVTHTTGSFLYAIAILEYLNGERVRKFYRSDGVTWEPVAITDPKREVDELEILCTFGDKLLISFDVSTGNDWKRVFWALDGRTQLEVVMPSASHPLKFFQMDDEWLYCLADQGTPSYQLYRTKELKTWELIGHISFPPGVEIGDMCFAGGRLYVGIDPRMAIETSDSVKLWFRVDAPITDATVYWDVDEPEGTQFKVQVSTTSESFNLDGPFFGPDGTADTFYTQSGQVLNSIHNGHQNITLNLYQTPNEKNEIKVRWVRLKNRTNSYTFAVSEGQGLYAAANSTGSAEYTSPIFKLDAPISGGKLFFEGITPDQTKSRFAMRSAKNQKLIASKPFVGPDGVMNTYYQTSGQPLWSGHDGDTIVQYRVLLTSENPVLSPALRKVQLVTRNVLDHFDIELDTDTWRAGDFHTVKVAARAADNTLIPVTGAVSLSATNAVPIEPGEFMMREGTGVVAVALKKATPTRLKVTLVDVTSSSVEIKVQPGVAASIRLTTDLESPTPNWAPMVKSGTEFSLTMSVQDSYRNIVTGYTGTVECWRWTFDPHELLYVHTFEPSDKGVHTFSTKMTKGGNLVCFDKKEKHVAGSQVVKILK